MAAAKDELMRKGLEAASVDDVFFSAAGYFPKI
jgi:hypothetical protein